MRSKISAEGMLQIDEVMLDVKNGQVRRSGGTHHLTSMECRLLRVFMLARGQVVPRAVLIKAIRETDYLDDTRILDVHICLLRKKIENDPRNPQYLRTVRGVGYRFMPY